MSKKKNKFQSGDGSVHIEHEEPAVTLEDYVVLEKASAFIQAYDPSPTESEADEVWNEARIRAFFGAYVEKTHGDTLPVYLSELKKYGFNLSVASTGELTLWLRYRRHVSSEIAGILEGTDGDRDEDVNDHSDETDF